MTRINRIVGNLVRYIFISGVVTAIVLPIRSCSRLETIETRITDAQMTKVDRRYMVATEHEPFQNSDALYRLKCNSGEIQNEAIRLKGQKVKLDVYGWRIPLFSKYRNIRRIRSLE